jgi:hypothetical protein
MRLTSWSAQDVQIFHWRDAHDNEVDLVLEDRASGKLVGIEVKSERRPSASHLRGLRALRQAYPERFHRGFVLHLGDYPLRFEDDLWAFPISLLWSIGDSVVPPPPLDLHARLRIAEQRYRSESPMDQLARENAGLDAVGARLLEHFEQFRAVFERLGFVVTTVGMTPDEDGRPDDVSWMWKGRLDIGKRARSAYVLVLGTRRDDDVEWLVQATPVELGVSNVNVHVPVNGDHSGIVERELGAIADRVDAIARWLDGREDSPGG